MLGFLTVFRFYRIPIDDVLVNFEEIQLIHLQPDAVTQGVALEEVRNCYTVDTDITSTVSESKYYTYVHDM